MRFITIYVLSLWCLCAAHPGREISNSFQDVVGHQNLHSILTSIEQRLRNLDSIYSMQLTPTLQDKLDQYQRKLEAIDMKIIRLESLMMLNLDKISENISARNFKDDIARTNLAKKIDSVYEGLSHRLTYADRKFDAHFAKTQGKLDSSLTHLEEIWDGISRRDETLEVELSDTISAIDDLKSSYVNLESNVSNLNRNYESSLRNQKSMLESHVSLNLIVQNLLENSTKNFEAIRDQFDYTITNLNESKFALESFEIDLKGDLNDYAVKVAEMNVENWKSGKTVLETYEKIGNGLNATRTEVQNGFRALMILVGKISNKDQPLSDSTQMDLLNNKLDSNFEKVFSAQNLFMDSCYRLQMDESQIESKISDILEKLVETFEKKTSVEIKDVRNLERIIRNHDSHFMNILPRIGRYVTAVHEQLNKHNSEVQNELTEVREHANGLFLLLQNKIASEDGQGNTELLEKIAILTNQSTNLLIESIEDSNPLRIMIFEEFLGNLSQSIDVIIGDRLSTLCNFNREANITINPPELPGNDIDVAIAQIFGRNPLSNDTTSGERVNDTNNDDEVEALIDQVFAQSSDNESVQENAGNTTGSGCKQDYRDLIDVRSNFGDDTSTKGCPSHSNRNDTEIASQVDAITDTEEANDDHKGKDDVASLEQIRIDQEVYDDIENDRNQTDVKSLDTD